MVTIVNVWSEQVSCSLTSRPIDNDSALLHEISTVVHSTKRVTIWRPTLVATIVTALLVDNDTRITAILVDYHVLLIIQWFTGRVTGNQVNLWHFCYDYVFSLGYLCIIYHDFI